METVDLEMPDMEPSSCVYRDRSGNLMNGLAVDRIGTPTHMGWFKDGVFHREDGPAEIWKVSRRVDNGYNDWRGIETIPDEIWSEGWYRNGLMHREDGPALFFPASGFGHYYLDGFRLGLCGNNIDNICIGYQSVKITEENWPEIRDAFKARRLAEKLLDI